MKREFKVEDRVAVYQGNAMSDCFQTGRETGKVIELESGMIRVLLDGFNWHACFYHPNQLRRLVKKKRREWILQGDPVACVSSYVHRPILGPELAMGEQVRVREVKERK